MPDSKPMGNVPSAASRNVEESGRPGLAVETRPPFESRQSSTGLCLGWIPKTRSRRSAPRGARSTDFPERVIRASADGPRGPKTIGGGNRHLSLRLAQYETRMRAVAFGGADWATELAEAEGPLEFAFKPFVNEFRGRRSVELQILDWRPAGATSATAHAATVPAERDAEAVAAKTE